jgi:hypothetical protein
MRPALNLEWAFEVAEGRTAVTNAKQNTIALLMTLIGASALVASTRAAATESSPSIIMTPGQTVSLDAGLRHVAGTFVVTDGQCDLSAEVSGAFADSSTELSTGALRVQTTLMPGSASRIDAGGGYVLQFSCKSGAKIMTATTLGVVRSASGDEATPTLANATGRRLPMLRATGI